LKKGKKGWGGGQKKDAHQKNDPKKRKKEGSNDRRGEKKEPKGGGGRGRRNVIRELTSADCWNLKGRLGGGQKSKPNNELKGGWESHRKEVDRKGGCPQRGGELEENPKRGGL